MKRSEPIKDCRAVPRYSLVLPITVYGPGRDFVVGHTGSTLNISTRGLCFLLGFAPSAGSVFDFTVPLSAGFEMRTEAFIHGTARVSRVAECNDNRFRIAASIERYEISRDRALARHS